MTTMNAELAPTPAREHPPAHGSDQEREQERIGYRTLLRERIGAELESLSAQLAHGSDAGSPLRSGTRGGRVALANVQGRVRWLGQLLAGLAAPGDLHLHPGEAGFGSTVHVTDVVSGERLSFTLMTGSTIDVAGDQVSIESPIGSSIVGARVGDVVEATTPTGPRRFRIDRVATLLARFA
ncbi:MAG TPA: GreA/GreB family elongation factor [Longimicrobiales bacterium]